MLDGLDVASHKTKDLAGAVGALGIEGKALFVDAAGQRELRARVAQRPGLKLVDALGVNVVRRARPTARSCSRSRRFAARRRDPGRRVMDAAGHHPAAAHHREVHAAARTRRTRSASRSTRAANKIEIARAVEKLFGVKVARRARRQRAGQVEAHGPVRRPAHGLEEGLRPARRRTEDRVLRGRVDGQSRSSSRPPPGGRFQTMLDFAELSTVAAGEAPDGRAARDRRPQQPGAADQSRFMGGGHKRRYRDHRLPPRQARTSRRRSRRSSTTRTARRASRCCTTPTARSATSSRPNGLAVGAKVVVGPDGRHRRRATRCRCARSRSARRSTTSS